jgi:hypothetical protein
MTVIYDMQREVEEILRHTYTLNAHVHFHIHLNTHFQKPMLSFFFFFFNQVNLKVMHIQNIHINKSLSLSLIHTLSLTHIVSPSPAAYTPVTDVTVEPGIV